MELNARLDEVGRDHKGKRIFRVITDGNVADALFLYEGDPVDSEASKDPDEPDLVGSFGGPINNGWLLWHKRKHNCSLKTSRDAGMAKLQLLESQKS